ncbi:MAG: hypothetical protein MR384_01570 [Lachnospiraceae bacterium]|nr:hypothetical protein [Lachnospiraceae bacterium]
MKNIRGRLGNYKNGAAEVKDKNTEMDNLCIEKEKIGRGIDRIYEGSIIYGRPWPDFSETTSSNVKLFIQRAKADGKFTKLISDEQNRLGKPLSIY